MTLGTTALVLWAVLAIFVNLELSGLILIALGLIAFVSVILLNQTKRALLSLIASALILSGISLSLQTESTKPPWMQSIIQEGKTHELELEILNRPKAIFTGFNGEPSFGVSVRLRKLSDLEVSARGYLIYQKIDLERGQLVKTNQKLREPGKNSRDSFLIRSNSDVQVIAEPERTQSFLNNLRSDYKSLLAGITPDARVLVGGLAIGEVGGLSKDLEQKMLTVSLSHLVAVSGSNCAIVVGMVYLIAVRLRFGRFGRTVVSLAALVGYVLLIGPDPSVLRAAVMSASVIVLVALGRRSIATNALAIAAVILLIADPWLAIEFGFGLSLSATAGILLLGPAIYDKLSKRLAKPLALGLSVTIAAQLFCLPLLMQLQPGLPTYSVIANLLAGPMVAPVTVLGMIALVLTPIAPIFVGPISWLASLGTWIIEAIAIFFAEQPIAAFPWLTGIPAAILSILLIFATGTWLRAKSLPASKLGLAALTVIAVATISVPAASEILPNSWPVEDWTFVACDVGQGDALILRSLGRTAVVDVGRDSGPIDQCLKDLKIRTIDLLVLTHFDADHVGGLAGAMENRVIETAIISGFPDERPATAISKEMMLEAEVRIITANPKIAGILGEYSWEILSPSLEATEANDSNDASVVMIFSHPEFEILLLGDLGEIGQSRIGSKVLAKLGNRDKPLVLKVSHHGSNDQLASLHESLRAEIGIISVGKENGYGHPGAAVLKILKQSGTQVLRTDELGSIALGVASGKLSWAASG